MKRVYLKKENAKDVIKEAIKVLSDGGLIIYPTETCYGLGSDAMNPKAIEQLFKYKTRREGKPLSIAVSNAEMARLYAKPNNIAENIYKNHLPGPITVVSESLHNVAPGVESEFGTIGIRIPDYSFVLDLVKEFGRPITATSANTSNQPKPYSFEAWQKYTSKKSQDLIDLFIDGGELPKRETSTVVDTTLNTAAILREGAVKFTTNTQNSKKIFDIKSKSVDDTIRVGAITMLKFINELYNRPVIFLLKGELGSGKTHFVKGIAKQLKISQIIKSPSYIIMSEYDYNLSDAFKGKLIHIDTWRIFNEKEWERLKLNNYLKSSNVIAIEWPEKFLDEILDEVKKTNAFVISVDFKQQADNLRVIKVFKKS